MTNWKITKYEQKLYDALKNRNVNVILHHDDGHKTVDMAILEANIYIEVDDMSHFTNPQRIISDFYRYSYSVEDKFNTFYVTNQIVEKYADKVADALVKVVEIRLKNIPISSIIN